MESRETRMQHNRTSNSKAESQSGDSIYLALRAVMKMEHREQDGLKQQGLPESHSPRSRHPPGLYAATARSFGQCAEWPFWILFFGKWSGRPVGRSINMTNAGTLSCPHRLSPQHQRHGQAFGTHSWIQPHVHSCFAHGVFGVSKGIHGVSLS